MDRLTHGCSILPMTSSLLPAAATTASKLDVATFAGVLGAGAVGGVFYAFSSFVMPALERLQPADGIKAMQSINVTAERPGFMVAFLGTTLLCGYLGVRGVLGWGDAARPCWSPAARSTSSARSC